MCGRLTTYHAQRAPTFSCLGKTSPVCKDCVDLSNNRRATRGLPLLKIPPGSYEPEPS
jgi:hypothetical protein